MDYTGLARAARGFALRGCTDQCRQPVEHVLRELLGHLPGDDFEQYSDLWECAINPDVRPYLDLVRAAEQHVARNTPDETKLAIAKLDEALKTFRDSLAIAERLAGVDRSNTQWQSDLATSYDRVGGVLVAQGKLDEALKVYREGDQLITQATGQGHPKRHG